MIINTKPKNTEKHTLKKKKKRKKRKKKKKKTKKAAYRKFNIQARFVFIYAISLLNMVM